MRYMFSNMWREKTYEKNQVYIDATIQFRPVSPATRVETHGFWHSLTPCCGEKPQTKQKKTHKKNQNPSL